MTSAEGVGAAPLPITVIILTLNEELHVARCVARAKAFAARVVVIDSFSTDKTVEIARELGAEVWQNPFKHNAAQFQWGVDTSNPQTDWIMKMDCDEYLEDGAIAELRRRLPTLSADVTGLEFKLKVLFQGQWIRHGRYYQTVLMRLWRRGAGRMEQRWMDEHIVLDQGRAERVTGGDLVDHNLKDIGWWTDKHNRYATRHMVDYINREYGLFAEDDRMQHADQAARKKRYLKNSVYGRMPIYLRSVLFYVYRYVFRLGFLDGKTGFLFHTLHGLWVMLLIDAKIDEARRFIKERGIEAFKDHLRTVHKIDVSQ